ncbi:hypothetical protein BJY00DRAFT_18664 [Aspergillus carlsbadensis]|nr:hypothetical protein BJY00DRAFT_18664 [Aspergillus carlsbadensis]
MEDVEQQEPIFELATECERIYTAQMSRLSSGDDQNATELLSELYKRFSTWAAFMGVFAEANVCLDRRLRRHIEIQDQVLRLLDLMEKNLRYLFEEGDSPKPNSIEPSKNVFPARQDLTMNIKCLDAIAGALERLNQLGTAIRRASVTSHTSKARQLVANSDLTSFEQTANICLQTLYPDASGSLIELLTQSMVESYALFLHRKSRYERLQVPRQVPQQQIRLTAIPEETAVICDGQDPMDIDSEEAPRVADRPTHRISRASVPSPGFRMPPSEPTSVDSKEFRARARSLINPTAKAKPVSILVNQAAYPRPGDKDGTGPCDWCFSPLMTECRVDSSKWREHINEDFKPYTCLSEKCSPSIPRFQSSRQWLQHMVTTHGESWYRKIHAPSSWICPLCNELGPSPQGPDGLSAHFESCHTGLFDEDQLVAIVRQSIYRVPRPRDTCPLCCFQIGEEPVSQSHVERNSTINQQAKHHIPTPDGFQSKRLKGEMGHSQPKNHRDSHFGGNVAPEKEPNAGEESVPISALGSETIGSHVAAHLQTVMLLTLRLISIDSTEDSTGSECESSKTDDQPSSVSLGTRNVRDELSDVEGAWSSYSDGDVDIDNGPPSLGSVPDSEPINWNNILGRPLESTEDSHVENSDVDSSSQSSSYEYYPIKGIEKGFNPDSQPPLRRELNEWVESKAQSDRDQVVLFILALDYFQAIDPNSKDSYFQIAGIYGMPYVSWDEPKATAEEVRGRGYSVHGNCLFPLWIRLYLLLFEVYT